MLLQRINEALVSTLRHETDGGRIERAVNTRLPNGESHGTKASNTSSPTLVPALRSIRRTRFIGAT